MKGLNEIRLAQEMDIKQIENRLKIFETSIGCLLREAKDIRKFVRKIFETENNKSTIYHPKLGRIQGGKV